MLNDNFYPTNEEKCSMGYTLEQHDISDAKHKKLDKQVIDITPKIEEKIGQTALTDKQFQDINQIEPPPSIN